jgi:DNA-binding winged helix-turn-helix (wHTH) protein/Tfp pilus assembly protein PilF
MSREISEIYEFGDFRLDVGERRLEHLDGRRNGSLPDKSFETLVHLVRNSGSLVPKDELISAVWRDTVVEENNLGKAIHSIRNFLGEGSREHEYVETVPKHGYRFVAPVTNVSPGKPSSDHEPGYEPRNARAIPIQSQAYDLYLRGKLKAGGENREDTDAAIKVLEAAIAIDPNLAGAYAQLARAYNTLAFKFSSNSDAKLYLENAEVAILKALALDPDLAEAHFARGLILWTRAKGFPHEQAIHSYQRSLALDPDSDETHHQLSMVYSHIGLLDEAHMSIRRALEINPNNTMARFRVGVYTAYQGKFDEAIAVFKTIPRDVSPILVDRCTAEALVQAGEVSKAESIVDRYLDATPRDEGGSFTSVKAVLLAKAGVTAKAEDAISRAVEIGEGFGHFHHTAHNIASALAAMNRPDESVRWLENAADSGFPNYTYFQIDPNLDPLRKHPAFVKLMSRLQIQLAGYKALV